MVKKISWAVSINVDEGDTSMLFNGELDVDAVDVLNFVISDNTVDESVYVEPSALNKISLLCIKSDQTISYTITDANGTKKLDVDKTQILLGTSTVSLIEKDPTTLKFTNKSGHDANVQILVGRKAM